MLFRVKFYTFVLICVWCCKVLWPMAAKSVEVSCRAYCKLQLHLAKYPHCAVNGLLLGCQRRWKQDKIIEIVDAIPLFHQCLHLTPMLEIALTHVDSHCETNQLFMAGYYEASENLHSSVEPSIFSTRVCDKIHENFGDCKLVVIDNNKVPKAKSLIFYEKLEGKWKQFKGTVEYDEDLSGSLQSLLELKVYRELVDFDNHLDDISLHWLNHPINKLIVMPWHFW